MKAILTWAVALIAALIAGIALNIFITQEIDNLFPDKFYITISVSAILFPITSFLCGQRVAPSVTEKKKGGYILITFLFTAGLLYISLGIIPPLKPYILYYYVFYTVGCIVDLLILLRSTRNEKQRL